MGGERKSRGGSIKCNRFVWVERRSKFKVGHLFNLQRRISRLAPTRMCTEMSSGKCSLNTHMPKCLCLSSGGKVETAPYIKVFSNMSWSVEEN